ENRTVRPAQRLFESSDAVVLAADVARLVALILRMPRACGARLSQRMRPTQPEPLDPCGHIRSRSVEKCFAPRRGERVGRISGSVTRRPCGGAIRFAIAPYIPGGPLRVECHVEDAVAHSKYRGHELGKPLPGNERCVAEPAPTDAFRQDVDCPLPRLR